MTSEAKAKELIEKFHQQMYVVEDGRILYFNNARQYVLICVDEILKEIPATICGYMPEGGTVMEIDNIKKYQVSHETIHL